MIKVLTFCDSLNNSNTYVIINNKKAIIIDPSNNIKMINKHLVDIKVKAVLLTHGHYDHFSSLEETINLYQVPCFLHKYAKEKVFDLDKSYAKMFGCFKIPNVDNEIFKLVNDGMVLELANMRIKVLSTPGHTNCSVVYIVDDMMFSGDTLFRLSVGRTDLATGDMIKQKNTIDMLKHVKKDYIVYPGHDEKTTLYFEQKNNPYFR